RSHRARKSKPGRLPPLRSLLVLRRVCARAWRRERNTRSRADFPMRLNGERAAPHFPWPEVRTVVAAKARNGISKTKMAEYSRCDRATPLRSNPRVDNHRRCERAKCKNTRPARSEEHTSELQSLRH